jgi:hypothetical protein
MSQKYATLIEAWKRAEAAAHDAEKVISNAYQAYFAGAGAPPTEQQIALARQLRKEARDQLDAAMSYLRTYR